MGCGYGAHIVGGSHQDALYVETSGSNDEVAGHFRKGAGNSSNFALWVQGNNTGSNSYAALFEKTYADDNDPVVKVYSTVTAPGLYCLNTNSDAPYCIKAEAQESSGTGATKAIHGYANCDEAVAGYFQNISSNTADVLQTLSVNTGYAFYAKNTKSSGSGPVAHFETTQSSNTGVVTQITSDGSGNAIDIDLNHTGDGIDINDAYGRSLLIKGTISSDPTSQSHDAQLMELINLDRYGDIGEAALIKHCGGTDGTDANHTLTVYGANNDQSGAALYVEYEGARGIREIHHETEYDGGIGTEIDIRSPNGAGLHVILDSTANDSAGIRVIQDGTGNGIVSHLTNAGSSNYAIHAISSSATGKAVYAEGEVECTKQIVAKGIKCHYEYDSGSGNPTANNLAVGTIFSCYDTKDKVWRLAIKTGDGTADYFSSGGSMDIDNP